MLSVDGVLEAITALSVMMFAFNLGILTLINAKEMKAKMLYFTSFAIIFIGLFYLGPITDFFSILFLDVNINNSFGLYGILSYMWIGPAVFVMMYLGGTLMMPEKKNLIMVPYLILAIIFEMFLFLDTQNSFDFVLITPGEELIDASFNRTSPTFILIAIFLISALVFNGIGSLRKAYQLSGDLRRNFTYMGIGFILFFVSGVMDTLTAPGPMLFIVRFGMICSVWFIYMGIKRREESSYISKKTPRLEPLRETMGDSLADSLSQSRAVEISQIIIYCPECSFSLTINSNSVRENICKCGNPFHILIFCPTCNNYNLITPKQYLATQDHKFYCLKCSSRYLYPSFYEL